ncbi:hypothetical protein FH972_021995 [Carpinus fangiana]|uniref:Ribosomal protein S11 n=1 Tax=Carpinus fangiana TaxID=176857 RepID=A0A5N6KRI6_9ROSI|nr:hypothetical protein FH972_021995 [Carpinus fangiana]
MHNSLLPRLSALRLCTSCRTTFTPFSRPFSSTPAPLAPGDRPSGGLSSLASNMSRRAKPSSPSVEGDLREIFGSDLYSRPTAASSEPFETQAARDLRETYYFHVYATKHNTHITVCTPKHEPMKKLSLSAGNIGFKKANRGTYDAAYQLASYVLSRIVEQGNLAEMKRVEIVLRGFGVGREAVTKAILGQEGSMIRSRIVGITDATRLKFGGTRSPKPRRLG